MGEARSAAVVGAGIGGLAAAIALRRAGWEVTVYEADHEHRPLGAGLSIWPNGVRALRRLGLAGAIDDGQHQAGGVRRADGRMLAGFKQGAVDRRFGEPLLGLHRAELHEWLLAGCGAERVRLGARVRAVEAAAVAVEGVELGFEDGSTATFDLVVGADGLHSAVRAALLADGPPRDAGLLAYRGVAAADGPVPAGEWWGRGSVAGLLPLRGGRLYWYFGCADEGAASEQPAAGPEPTQGEEPAARLRRLAAAYEEPVGAAVAATPPGAVLVHRLYDRDPVGSWSRGAATLLGDAAHPMLPFIGQGAGAALEDAVVLGQALAGGVEIDAGLAAYERARLERAALFVKESRRAAAIALPRSGLARRLRDALLPLVPESTRLRQFARFLEWTP